jgi:hypothetical protein
VTYSGFYLPWFAALAIASGEPSPAAGATILHFQGLNVPVVQAVLAIAGVLMARPLARKKESTLPLSHFLIVTAIMLITSLAWVAQSRPGVLFTFVVAIGLGFSGYALVETAGAEIQNFMKRVFAQATDVLGSTGVKK